MGECKPNYYAVIPATVRYDKDLSPNAKLLYGEITSLANSKGYCWATNSYFMKLYNISSERTIQILLKQLSDKNYISIHIEKNKNRKIYLTDNPAENYGVTPQKNAGMSAKKCGDNNKNNNNKEYNNKIDIFDYDWLNE